MNIRRLIFSILLFAPSGHLHAQHPMMLAKLNEWNDAAPVVGHEILKAQILKKAAEIYGGAPACNRSGITVDAVEPATADRYAFTGVLEKTLRNAWFVTARLPGCDSAPVRYMVIQSADNSLQTIRVNRGQSYAWDSLIGDTLPLAQLAAAAALKRKGFTCSSDDKPVLGVTRVVVKEPNLGDDIFGIRYSGSWTEVWPIQICKRTVEVSIKFTADGDGGAFNHIPGDDTRVLP